MVKSDEEIKSILGNTPMAKRLRLGKLFGDDLRLMDYVADNYDGVILTVNDDEQKVLRQVTAGAMEYNLAAEGFNTYGNLDVSKRMQLPYLWVAGFLDSNLLLGVYDALDQMFRGQYPTLKDAMNVVNKGILITEPGATKDIPPRTVCYHAQDLKLEGQRPGARLFAEIDAKKKEGYFERLHFASPWSSLSAAKGRNLTGIDAIVYAEQFYVLELTKEYNRDEESYAPGLISGVLEGIGGKLKLVNRGTYRGPLKLY